MRPQPLTAAKTPSLQFRLRFNFLTPLFDKPAAGSAFTLCLLSTLALSSRHFLTSVQRRSYAKRKMPPKKAVKEEKILLGRPGNNLKSGIVCTDPDQAVSLKRHSTDFSKNRLAWPMSASLHSSKRSRKALWAILPTSPTQPSNRKKLEFLSQMPALTGCASITSQSPRSPPI